MRVVDADAKAIRENPTMSRPPRSKTPLIVLALTLVVGGLGVWALRNSPGAVKARARDARLAAALAEGPAEPAPSLEVEVEIAQRRPIPEIVELAGVLEPVRRTWVAAEISGRILAVPAEEFASIEEGGLLVQLDDALPRAELIRAEAAHRLAQSELRRQERLEGRSVASEAELEAARAAEQSSYAAVLEARTRLEHTRIRAPFDGLVNQLDLDPGAYVQPGSPIAEILDVSVLEVEVLVGDRQIAALSPGHPAPVRIDALGNTLFEGRIVRVGRAPRADRQRYPVVVALTMPAPEATLGTPAEEPTNPSRPGMLAHVRLEVGQTPAIRVPARAVVREFELDYVFVVDETDVVRRTRVETRPVPFRPDRIEVTGGLDEGDRIAVTGIEQLRSGLRVLVR
jgi:membrane fusion protein (multidrug efflux system)